MIFSTKLSFFFFYFVLAVSVAMRDEEEDQIERKKKLTLQRFSQSLEKKPKSFMREKLQILYVALDVRNGYRGIHVICNTNKPKLLLYCFMMYSYLL